MAGTVRRGGQIAWAGLKLGVAVLRLRGLLVIAIDGQAQVVAQQVDNLQLAALALFLRLRAGHARRPKLLPTIAALRALPATAL